MFNQFGDEITAVFKGEDGDLSCIERKIDTNLLSEMSGIIPVEGIKVH